MEQEQLVSLQGCSGNFESSMKGSDARYTCKKTLDVAQDVRGAQCVQNIEEKKERKNAFSAFLLIELFKRYNSQKGIV
jgi:hypothetical protein